jgi:hypothetical protein
MASFDGMGVLHSIPVSIDLQERLDRLYKLLKGQELAKDEAETAEKARIQLKIDGQWKEIRTVEQQYAIALSQQIKRSDDLPEPFAETIVGELVDELELIQPKTDEMRSMLQEILVKLNEPGVPAAAKLKVAIPLVPGFVAIELEGDAESVVRRMFPTFVKAYKHLKKKMS